MVPIPPKAEHRANQRRHRDGPTNQSGHAETEPDTLASLTLGPELAGSLRCYLPGKGSLLSWWLICRIIPHAATPQNDL
jgi:hypothetical protein